MGTMEELKLSHNGPQLREPERRTSSEHGVPVAAASAVPVEPASDWTQRSNGEEERNPVAYAIASSSDQVIPVASVIGCDAATKRAPPSSMSNKIPLGGKSSKDPFEHHDKHQFPPPPSGMEWTFQLSSHRWVLQPLAEAEITVLDPPDETQFEEAPATLEHWIQPSDTLQGLCLKYGVTTTQIRRANYGFSGSNLSLAPNPLKVPNIFRAVPEAKDRSQLLETFRLAFRGELAQTEAKCYLELNDWDLTQALQNAERDLYDQDYTLEEKAKFDTPIQQVVFDEEL